MPLEVDQAFVSGVIRLAQDRFQTLGPGLAVQAARPTVWLRAASRSPGLAPKETLSLQALVWQLQLQPDFAGSSARALTTQPRGPLSFPGQSEARSLSRCCHGSPLKSSYGLTPWGTKPRLPPPSPDFLSCRE